VIQLTAFAAVFVAALFSQAMRLAGLGVCLGIPDLNLPMSMYWGLIFLGFVFCPADAPMDTAKP
jgi:hypothetical protein